MVTIILIYLIIQGVYLIIKYLYTQQFIQEHFSLYQDKPFVPPEKKFIILIPVLHEEKIIQILLDKLERLNYPKDLYQIAFITTEKEYTIPSKGPNTIELLDTYLNARKPSHIIKLHYPRKNGFKSEQLQYAYHYYSKTVPYEKEEYFFYLLDADAELHPNTLLILNSSIEQDIHIYQQPILWLRNFSHYNYDLSSTLIRGFCINQTYHAIAYEIPMIQERFYPWRLRYFMGSGLCIRASFLNSIGGFPSLIEDTRMGRVCSFLKEKSKIAPLFNVVDTTTDVWSLVKQTSVWFIGCNLFIRDYRLAKTINPNISLIYSIYLIGYGLFKSLRWMNKSILLLISIFFITEDPSPLNILTILALLLNVFIPSFLVLRDMKWLLAPYSIQVYIGAKCDAFIGAPFIYCLGFLGPYVGLIKLWRFVLCSKIELPKTNR